MRTRRQLIKYFKIKIKEIKRSMIIGFEEKDPEVTLLWRDRPKTKEQTYKFHRILIK